MTKDEFAALSAAIQAETTIYKPVFRGPPRTENSKAFKYSFYPISQLQVLIDLLKIMPLDTFDEDNLDIFSVRYLVTTDKKILFAREGAVSKYIPAHRQIRNTCIAAGNIFFSRDFKTITKINHQSGDFHPSTSSLFWPLAILYAMKAPLATPFIIEKGSISNGNYVVCAETKTTVADLKSLIPPNIIPQLIDKNSSNIIEVEEYGMNTYSSQKRSRLTLSKTHESSENSGSDNSRACSPASDKETDRHLFFKSRKRALTYDLPISPFNFALNDVW